MIRLGSLFTGGGLFDVGAHQVPGVHTAWGVEINDRIHDVARTNGVARDVVLGDVTQVNPALLPPVDWIHASPPCPNFSIAKIQKTETEKDIAMGKATAHFIRTHEPSYFTLENVLGYRGSKSFGHILTTLDNMGYSYTIQNVNAADFGVPQKRVRMILMAKRSIFNPPALQPTHAKDGQGGMLPWVGWWEAVKDLEHTFPDSELAPWQMKRLQFMEGDMALIWPENASNNTKPIPPDQPALTLRAGRVYHPRIVMIEGSVAGDRPPKLIDQDEPAPTVRAGSGGRKYRAVTPTRVLALSTRAIARLQTIPDTYGLPKKPTLSYTIIGNGVPCLLAKKIAENLQR